MVGSTVRMMSSLTASEAWGAQAQLSSGQSTASVSLKGTVPWNSRGGIEACLLSGRHLR